jgi:hypothetical protein
MFVCLFVCLFSDLVDLKRINACFDSSRKKATIVKKDKPEMSAAEELGEAAANRVSNQRVHSVQQYYRVVPTPDGNQTVALKSVSREADLDNRVKKKSDRFCMHT